MATKAHIEAEITPKKYPDYGKVIHTKGENTVYFSAERVPPTTHAASIEHNPTTDIIEVKTTGHDFVFSQRVKNGKKESPTLLEDARGYSIEDLIAGDSTSDHFSRGEARPWKELIPYLRSFHSQI
jgi:hypothetical protein